MSDQNAASSSASQPSAASFRVAALQMVSTPDRDRNVAEAGRLIAEAAADGAQLVLLPEYFCFMGFRDTDKLAVRESQAFRNSTLQGAYLMLAARALGLDCGPMSGFDNAAVDADFFAAEPNWKSNFICSIGYGDPASIFGRSPRPDFDTFNRIL